MNQEDPVHQDPDGKWYFYIETWADREGPFDSRDQAHTAMVAYAKEVLGIDIPLQKGDRVQLSAEGNIHVPNAHKGGRGKLTENHKGTIVRVSKEKTAGDGAMVYVLPDEYEQEQLFAARFWQRL